MWAENIHVVAAGRLLGGLPPVHRVRAPLAGLRSFGAWSVAEATRRLSTCPQYVGRWSGASRNSRGGGFQAHIHRILGSLRTSTGY